MTTAKINLINFGMHSIANILLN